MSRAEWLLIGLAIGIGAGLVYEGKNGSADRARLAAARDNVAALEDARDLAVAAATALRVRLDERDSLIIARHAEWETERAGLRDQATRARAEARRLAAAARLAIPDSVYPVLDSLVAAHDAETTALRSQVATLTLENAELWAYRHEARETLASLDTALRASRAVEDGQRGVNVALSDALAAERSARRRDRFGMGTLTLAALAVAVLR